MEQEELMMSEVKNNLGTIHIADDVVRIIAGLAAIEVPGVVGMSGGMVGGIAERLGYKNLSKGVKVEVGEKEVAVDLFIIVEYGSNIPEVATQIQDVVKETLERMTGLTAVEINVNVQGVTFANELNEEDNNRVK